MGSMRKHLAIGLRVGVTVAIWQLLLEVVQRVVLGSPRPWIDVAIAVVGLLGVGFIAGTAYSFLVPKFGGRFRTAARVTAGFLGGLLAALPLSIVLLVGGRTYANYGELVSMGILSITVTSALGSLLGLMSFPPREPITKHRGHRRTDSTSLGSASVVVTATLARRSLCVHSLRLTVGFRDARSARRLLSSRAAWFGALGRS